MEVLLVKGKQLLSPILRGLAGAAPFFGGTGWTIDCWQKTSRLEGVKKFDSGALPLCASPKIARDALWARQSGHQPIGTPEASLPKMSARTHRTVPPRFSSSGCRRSCSQSPSLYAEPSG